MDNYAVQAEAARRKFLTFDRAALAGTFGLERDGEYLRLTFAGRALRIGPDGAVERLSPPGWRDAGFRAAMSVYDMLCNPCGLPRLSGVWCPGAGLRGLQLSGDWDTDGFFASFAVFFSGRGALLADACRALGGVPAGQGDVAFELPLFSFFPVRLQFWERDEEFPAQLRFLWDRDTCRWFHYETTFYAVQELLEHLRERMEEREGK